MAVFSAAIYLSCILLLAGPTAPFVAEAVGLRSYAPDRSHSATASSGASPADVEEEEEDEGDSSADQPPAVAFPAVQPQPPQEPQAFATQQRSVPNSQPPVPVDIPRPSLAAVPTGQAPSRPPQLQVAAAAPQPLHAARQGEALFQFTPPREPNPLPEVAAVPKVKHVGKVPMWIARRKSQQAMPASWPPPNDSYNSCDPPCIVNRGICNDNVCFCRSPFTGTTCQHKISALYRASKVMVVGFAALCVLLGILLSKLVMTFAEAHVETRLERFGSNKQRFEKWMPPEQEKGGKKAPKKQDAGA